MRTQGKGRVFYTAFGHDERTWRNPGFQQLVEQATVWAVSDTSRQAWQRLKMPDVTYLDGFNVPNYEKRDPAPKYQMPFSPADSMKFIQVPAEFDLQLFAREPDIIKPITFSFDARGRLWVIEAIDYPNLVLNGEPGADRIKILEDTNGDGRADKFTVFADRLNLATSLVFVKGGVDRRGGAAHAAARGHQRRRQGGQAHGAEHGLGHQRQPRRPVEPALRARQLHLGHRRLRRLQGRDERPARCSSRRASSGSSRMGRPSSS